MPGLKSAQYNLVLNLSRQYVKTGVTINNLAPGLIDTDRNRFLRGRARTSGGRPSSGPARWAAPGSPTTSPGAALLLCSDAGSFITGANINVTGGGDLPWT